MATERVERRLTAILAADVAGYSRLAGLDEEGTHVQLTDHLRSLLDPKIAEHRGRVVKNTGDKNVSGDPEQEYFVDGITEDIITALSKWRWFLVISRNSTFAYKAKSVDLRQIRRDLDVRYVLQGSVRKAGQRVRITSQLIDAATGTHLWAERYDHELTDIFAVQDEITSRVVVAIEPALETIGVSRGVPSARSSNKKIRPPCLRLST